MSFLKATPQFLEECIAASRIQGYKLWLLLTARCPNNSSVCFPAAAFREYDFGIVANSLWEDALTAATVKIITC